MLTTPLVQCALFGTCGGCSYQDTPYDEQLRLKKQNLIDLFATTYPIPSDIVQDVLPSPQPYHTRHRIDLTIIRRKDQTFAMGYSPQGRKNILEVDACPIARQEISNFIPQLKQDAITQWPEKYKRANLTIRSGDNQKVYWGGIGRGSLKMVPSDYMYTDIHGLRIFYAMETFFQANLHILPSVMQCIQDLIEPYPKSIFLDLYSGVGLFGLSLADHFERVILIEDNKASHALAKHNIAYHQLSHVKALEQQVETALPDILFLAKGEHVMVLIDPPRKGLSSAVRDTLKQAIPHLDILLYLSCNPKSLVRDLQDLCQDHWQLHHVQPMDFFPQTHHLETLVVLEPKQ